MAKIIESNFPFSQLSLIAERESWRKEIYRPVYYLHKWWARRLGSVFRGIILGACLEESDDFWEHFYSSNDFGDTIVYDPFMGSGVTVGEAIKLGCRVIGRDINPVAWISSLAAFTTYSPVDVLSTYRQLEKKLAQRLLTYYHTTTKNGDSATVLYYFLVKIITCPICKCEIKLFKSRIFSRNAVTKKDPSARSICPKCGEINLTVFNAKSTKCFDCGLIYNPQIGNIKGAKVTCNHCQANFKLVDEMKSLGAPLKFYRYAKMLLTEDGQKLYETLNDKDRELEHLVSEEYASIAESFPNVSIAPGYNTNQMIKHNYSHWREVLSDRQLVCTRHMIDAISEIEEENLRTLFACLFSGVLEFNNLFTSFKGEGTGAVRHMFANHVLKPEVMPLEANMWGTKKSSGSFSTLFNSRVMKAIGYKEDPFELRLTGSKSSKVWGINKPIKVPISTDYQEFKSNRNSTYLSCDDSSSIDIPDDSVDLVVTDPPFFDNVHYSQLADFFYYWLNQILNISSSTSTRSQNEVQDTDSKLFTSKLTAVFTESHRILRPGGLFIFTYHHARHEGWVAVHRAIRNAGFSCIQSFPIKAEMSVSIPLRQAKSPIHLDLILVCREEFHKEEFDKDVAVSCVLSESKNQINSLKKNNIDVSLGDTKVTLMGRVLCEVHKINNHVKEENFLREIESNIDSFVSDLLSTEDEEIYGSEPHISAQMALFEEIEEYLQNDSAVKTVENDT